MHIAIEASTWVNTRGYGRFTRELTRALLRAESPHRFTIVVDSGAARAMPDLPGADVVAVGTTRAVVDAATAESARSIGDLARMAARLSRGFDAVLFPTNYSFVPLFPGTRIAVVVHDAIPETLPALVLGGRRARLLWTLKNQLAFRQADLIATVSEASKREISRRLPVGRKDILVLTEGVADAFSSHATVHDEALVRSAVPRPGRYILFVGGISPHKRVAELVRAFGDVASRSGFEDLHLVLAGPDGRDQFAADQAGVTEAIRALGASSARVVRTGFLPDAALAAVYRGAACVVLPSLAEGFGLPALEAMSSGTPLIVSRTPALQEVCGQAAEYVDDIEDLPRVLAGLLSDLPRQAVLRRAGLERAGTFGWDESARRLLAAFDRLAQA